VIDCVHLPALIAKHLVTASKARSSASSVVRESKPVGQRLPLNPVLQSTAAARCLRSQAPCVDIAPGAPARSAHALEFGERSLGCRSVFSGSCRHHIILLMLASGRNPSGLSLSLQSISLRSIVAAAPYVVRAAVVAPSSCSSSLSPGRSLLPLCAPPRGRLRRRNSCFAEVKQWPPSRLRFAHFLGGENEVRKSSGESTPRL